MLSDVCCEAHRAFAPSGVVARGGGARESRSNEREVKKDGGRSSALLRGLKDCVFLSFLEGKWVMKGRRGRRSLRRVVSPSDQGVSAHSSIGHALQLLPLPSHPTPHHGARRCLSRAARED